MFPFTINNTFKLLSHNSDNMEDDAIKERINQTILQSIGMKKNVKINAIVVIECDNEPKRTLVINESSSGNSMNPNIHISSSLSNNAFSSISTNSVANHTGVILQQPSLFSTTIEDLQALFNITPNLQQNITRHNISMQDHSNPTSFLFNSNHNSSPESVLKPDKPSETNESGFSSRKRKSEKPTKIPQENSPNELNGLDLTLTVKQEHINFTDTDNKIERFFNSNLPIWPCATSTDIKPYISTQQPTTMLMKPKKTQAIAGHKKSSKVFNCNQCKLQFNSLNALCKHTFSDHRAFRCTFCSANFTQRSNLQRHSLKHVGFKPFICNVCSKAYYRKDHLVRHIEVSHPGSDPKSNITVKLSSSECLEYLERMQNNRLLELENAEENKAVMNSMCLEPLEKSSPFGIHVADIDSNNAMNEDCVTGDGNEQSECSKFISYVKDDVESPGNLQISIDDKPFNGSMMMNCIKVEDIIPVNLTGNIYLENCQEQALKNCI